jgi:hypothetical protein
VAELPLFRTERQIEQKMKCPFDGHEMGAATKIGMIWLCSECDYHGRPLTLKEFGGYEGAEIQYASYGNEQYWNEVFKEHPELIGKSEQELSDWYDEANKDWTGYGASNVVRERLRRE